MNTKTRNNEGGFQAQPLRGAEIGQAFHGGVIKKVSTLKTSDPF